jgi:hypothetical protein
LVTISCTDHARSAVTTVTERRWKNDWVGAGIAGNNGGCPAHTAVSRRRLKWWLICSGSGVSNAATTCGSLRCRSNHKIS